MELDFDVRFETGRSGVAEGKWNGLSGEESDPEGQLLTNEGIGRGLRLEIRPIACRTKILVLLNSILG